MSRKDFEIREARDVTLTMPVVDGDENETIEGSEIFFWMARHKGSTAPVLVKSLSDGIEITDDLEFVVEIDAPDTEGFTGKYYYEAMIHTPDGNKVTAAHGYITVDESLIGGASE